MSNKYISEKRDTLLRFVREQIIGPNSYNGKFGQEGCVTGESITEGSDVWKYGEVIDTTPGSVYCSGILFPKRETASFEPSQEDQEKNNADNQERATVTSTEDTDGDEQIDNGGATTDETPDENESHEINQRFPQSCGISCCLSPDVIKDNDLTVVASGRYYTKIQDVTTVYVNVDEQDIDAVTALLQLYIENGDNQSAMSSFFRLTGNHLFLRIKTKTLYQIIKNGLDNYNKQQATQIRKTDLSWKKENKEPYLASYKEYLYNNRYKNKKLSQEERSDAKKRIEKIEKVERTLSYFYDLLYGLDSRGYGFWRSEDYSVSIDLTDIDFNLGDSSKKIYKPSDFGKLKDIVSRPFGRISKDDDGGLASLSTWIQITRDTRNANNKSIYLKVLLENTSSIMKETSKNQFSIVNESVNARSFFGVSLNITSKYIKPYDDYQNIQNNDSEMERLNYIYRNIKDYGVGHICSVDWDDRESTKRIWTEFMPHYDVPDVEPVPQKIQREGSLRIEPWISNTKYLEFYTLSTLSDSNNDQIIKGLIEFANSYNYWIQELNDPSHPEEASKIRQECTIDYQRIMANIKLLEDDNNMLCFRVMNTAMYMQLWHSNSENQDQYSKDNRGKMNVPIDYYKSLTAEVVKGKGNAAWRSFQLAFILLNLDGIINNPDDDGWLHRNKYVDLVWFPTGGGKTESYLGIIAFAIIYRRRTASIQGNNGGGTTAIMRYTLRLLATQQFQRATRLILSLEIIRSWGIYQLGKDPISIGLYVGDASLPNIEKDLIEEAKKWKEDKPSKIPLDHHRCPWCGGEMDWVERKNGRRIERKFICKHSFCFYGGLPILLCDEYIYSNPPTLLFGTIDKFAMIAHKVSETGKEEKDSRRLFKHNNLTPDLIIQDELHLLSGPLGSAAGLFECAIDQLCTRTMRVNGRDMDVRPKIISSTATTRNTELQIRALYGRNVNVFPKNGINYDDSFYAFYKRNKDLPNEYYSKRKYVGIMPTGRTSMYCQLRLASCVFAHRALYEKDHQEVLTNTDYIQAVDYYFTLVSYFNSIKDVGITDAQFASEFPKYTRQVLKRTLRPEYMLNCYYAYNDSFSKQELTGRLGGDEVVNALDEVQEKWNPDIRDVHYSNNTLLSGSTPPDLVLATNMISVGIDISRFNCMIVNSMPRNKAEYIQATSRVARDELGVVFTLHNPFRARDVSHYERFREFHEKLYYYVEPISITPFSANSIERYLPLYLSTIIRHSNAFGLSTDNKVKSITQDTIDHILAEVRCYFSKLAADCDNLTGQLHDVITNDDVNAIVLFTKKALQEWLNKKDDLNTFSSQDGKSALFTAIDAYEEEKNDTCWVVPTSLRIVPIESVLKINND